MRMVHAAHVMGAAVTVACPTVSHAHNTSIRTWVGAVQSGSPLERNSLVPIGLRKHFMADRPETILLRERFADIRKLTDGWDGQGSLAPDPVVLNNAARILNAILKPRHFVGVPVIVPVADGGIQAEWYSPSHRFEMYFDSDGEVSAWSNNTDTGVEMEEDGTAALQLLADWTSARESDQLFTA